MIKLLASVKTRPPRDLGMIWPLTILKLMTGVTQKLKHKPSIYDHEFKTRIFKIDQTSFRMSPQEISGTLKVLKLVSHHWPGLKRWSEYSSHIRFQFETDWWDGIVWGAQLGESNSAFVHGLDNSKLIPSFDKNFPKFVKLLYSWSLVCSDRNAWC